MEKQTAGRNQLGDFAPKFAELNDDVLFGQVWAREDKLSAKERSVITVTALMSKGILDSSLQFHIANARKNGVTAEEMAEILTHAAFYAGWPNAWAAFRMAKEVYKDDIGKSGAKGSPNGGMFGLGQPNDAYAKYFTGKSYLNPVVTEGINISNVTFEPGCRNNWHIHHGDRGGGQILLCVSGEGWYQEWEKPARRLEPGDSVYIAPGIKHWHGATKDSWFSHLAMGVPGENTSTEWCEPVDDAQYAAVEEA